nr:hypothetical protein [uncultured Microbacterium sp.]
MEQNPVPGQEALAPPSADVAKKYLEEADAVVVRRERTVDRRSLAWLQLANAVIVAAFLFAYAVVLRRDVPVTPQVMLFAFLLWGQLSHGIAARSGMQTRLTRERWPLVVAGAVLVVGTVVVFGIAVFAEDVPVGLLLAPSLAALIGFGTYGILQVVIAARESGRSIVQRTPMSRSARVGTILVGVALGSLIVLGGAPDGLLTLLLAALVAMLMVAWFVAGGSDLGPQAVAGAWRWPHMAAFMIAGAVLVASVLSRESDSATHWLPILVGGATVVLLFVGASFVPGRGAR